MAPQRASSPLALCVVGGLSAELICTVELDRATTVREAKVAIQGAEGTHWEEQRLISRAGRLFLDGELLSEALGDALPRDAASAEVMLMRIDPVRAATIRGIKSGRIELEDLDDDMRSDLEVALVAVQADGHALLHVGGDLRGNRDLTLAAVGETGMALKHAAEEMRQDREVVRLAVRQHGEALQHAAMSMRADAEVVLAALSMQNREESVLRHASASLRDDRDFMLRALKVSPASLRHASERLKSDKELVLMAIKDYPEALFAGGEPLQKDLDFVLSAVRINGCAIAHAAPEVRENPVVLAAAMQNTPEALAWLRRLQPTIRNKLIRQAQAVLEGNFEEQ